jgi:maleate isomerase
MAGTAGAFNGGPGFDRELVKRIEDASGTRATTTMTAVLQALRALRVRRLAIATSYMHSVDAALREVLIAEGFDVLRIQGMGILKSIHMGDVQPERTYEFGRGVFRAEPDADAYFISCGNLRGLEAAARLEQELGKPVITSNQAGLWHALQICGIAPSEVNGGGQLFRVGAVQC